MLRSSLKDSVPRYPKDQRQEKATGEDLDDFQGIFDRAILLPEIEGGRDRMPRTVGSVPSPPGCPLLVCKADQKLNLNSRGSRRSSPRVCFRKDSSRPSRSEVAVITSAPFGGCPLWRALTAARLLRRRSSQLSPPSLRWRMKSENASTAVLSVGATNNPL